MYLAQLSFAELVISFSTWQVEQKRIGQEDFVHLLCSIPDIWGEERNRCVCLSRCATRYTTPTSERRWTPTDSSEDGNAATHGGYVRDLCISLFILLFTSACAGEHAIHQGSGSSSAGRRCVNGKVEKRQTDLASVTAGRARPGQARPVHQGDRRD